LLCHGQASKEDAHLHNALHRLHALAEQVHVELLEARARDAAVEIDALEQRVDLDGRLRAD
jgi:hypothetical protein